MAAKKKSKTVEPETPVKGKYSLWHPDPNWMNQPAFPGVESLVDPTVTPEQIRAAMNRQDAQSRAFNPPPMTAEQMMQPVGGGRPITLDDEAPVTDREPVAFLDDYEAITSHSTGEVLYRLRADRRCPHGGKDTRGDVYRCVKALNHEPPCDEQAVPETAAGTPAWKEGFRQGRISGAVSERGRIARLAWKQGNVLAEQIDPLGEFRPEED